MDCESVTNSKYVEYSQSLVCVEAGLRAYDVSSLSSYRKNTPVPFFFFFFKGGHITTISAFTLGLFGVINITFSNVSGLFLYPVCGNAAFTGAQE